MAKKRGFLAEVNRQLQQDARRREQAQRQASRAHATAQRNADQAARQAERAQTQLLRATAAEMKRAEQEFKRLHVAAMEAEAEARNAELAAEYEQIDHILEATLGVDDYVDLERLRRVADHPPFKPGDLGVPALPPPPLQAPPEPQFVAPDGAPKGLSGMLRGKKKYAEVLAQAQAEHATVHATWKAGVDALPGRQQSQAEEFQRAERDRQARLEESRKAHDEECRRNDAEIAESNAALDQLITNLGYDVEGAVQEYVSIVLGNSVFPDCFPVEHEFEFASAHRELTLKVAVPAPTAMPSVREFKYVKAKDEIASTPLPQKDQKERYASAVAQVALRTLHEVFEADRAGRIQTISLTVVTEALDPATGRMTQTPLVAVASDRDTFGNLDLSNVVPAATLGHLNAVVSKNPFGLVPIDTSKGVRG